MREALREFGMDLGWASALALFLTSALVAFGCIFLLAALQEEGQRLSGTIFADRAGGMSFLFDGEMLVDATPPARALLAQALEAGPWARMIAALSPRYPGLEGELARLPAEGTVTLHAGSDGTIPALQAELRGGLTRICLTGEAGPAAGDALVLKTRQDDLAQMRAVLAGAQLPIWIESVDGAVTWANSCYLHRAADRLEPGQDLTWPLPQLFGPQTLASPDRPGRHRLTGPDGRAQWFDLQQADQVGARIGYALPVDDLVRSEMAQLEYKRMISSTFANLPIGLAIFDNRRHLVQFNPALVDLSRLPTDFLLARPTVFGLLDALRDSNMIPEPKDYRAWCRNLTEARTPDSHEEIWNLPSGQTYRLTGRPYPDGALALMFEDISTEVSHIRRYRAEIELGQSVLDAMPEAVAVFSPSGQLLMTNRRYAEIWGHSPAETLGGGNLDGMVRHWQENSAATPFWSAVEAFCTAEARQTALEGEVRLGDDRLVACHFAHLPGHDRLARFRIKPPMPHTAEAAPPYPDPS